MVSAFTHTKIESAVNAWNSASAWRRTAATSSSLRFVRRQATQAARCYPAALSNQLRSALESIRGKSVSDDFAYCIFNYADGYIQYASDPWGNAFTCEISSHRYVPEIELRLSEKVFYFLNAAGFEWPKGRANFARRFLISDARDLDTLAKFSLAALTHIMGLSPADRTEITAHIPRYEEICQQVRRGRPPAERRLARWQRRRSPSCGQVQ
jgi:hypothetical protein